MTQPIEPHLITKPIQLLAAWLAGLVLVDTALLSAASTLDNPSWGPGLLVIAAVAAIPVFLICIFLLQTRFRPEMQEDAYYSEYLRNKMTGKTATFGSEAAVLRQQSSDVDKAIVDAMRAMQAQLTDLVVPGPRSSSSETSRLADVEATLDLAIHRALAERVAIEINDLLPQYPQLRADLERGGLTIADTFGSSSQRPDVPEPFLMTTTEGVPAEVFRKCLAVALDHGLQAVQYGDDEPWSHKLYIGSYGYADDPVAWLNDDLVTELMNQSLSADEIAEVIRRAPSAIVA